MKFELPAEGRLVLSPWRYPALGRNCGGDRAGLQCPRDRLTWLPEAGRAAAGGQQLLVKTVGRLSEP